MTKIVGYFVSVLFTFQIKYSSAISCSSILQTLDCLPAFTHQPSHLPKCYCTTLCPDIENLRQSCQSGQLQTDPCGVCLQCAPGFGEKCGGFANEAGVCAGSLGCLVEYNPLQEVEHNKTGTCVTEQGAQCKNVKSGVSCRPGQIGVPSDFVFCPAPIVAPSSVELCKNNRTKNQHSNRVASGSGGISGSQGFLFSGTSTGTNQNRNNRPPGQR